MTSSSRSTPARPRCWTSTAARSGAAATAGPVEGSNRTGAEGADLVIGVPDGTVVKTPNGEVLADLVGAGTQFVAAAGGKGGLGNAALASPRRKARGSRSRASRGRSASLSWS